MEGLLRQVADLDSTADFVGQDEEGWALWYFLVLPGGSDYPFRLFGGGILAATQPPPVDACTAFFHAFANGR
jgi:hypothetical protein